MNTDIAIGCVVVAAAVGLVTYLVLWSRRTIDRIAQSDSSTAREIVNELRGG